MASEDIPLDPSWTKSMGWDRGKGKKKERGERMKEKYRQKLYLYSRFLGDRTVGLGQSKRQSSFSRQEFQVRTEIREFRQTPRGRGFLLLGYSCLKSHENGFGSCEAGNGRAFRF